MKKLTALLLSVILLLGLCLPAAAVEDFDPPLWEEYGYSSKEELLEDWGITDADYDEMLEEEHMWRDWHYDEATGDFDPPLWAYYGYASKQDMMDDWGLTEDDYAAMVQEERLWQERQDWTDEEWELYFTEQLQSEKKALGLIYDINVMLRDKPFSFTDAVPEITNGRTMVPLRAVMENMGAQVEYDEAARTAVITAGDKALTFVLGSDRFTLDDSGAVSEITLDSVPYIKNSRVFVPIRFVAEALGYDVLWSEEYRTAVFLDRENIVSELNEGFTVANKVLNMNSGVDLTKNYKGTSALDIKVTCFDSIAGNKVYTGGMDAVVLGNDRSAKMTIRFDVQSVIKLVKSLAAEQLEMDEEETQEILEILNTLDDDSIELIIDLESGMYYFRSQLIALILRQEGVEFNGKHWIAMDLNELAGVDFTQLMDAAQNMTTMGELLYMNSMNTWYDPVYVYAGMLTELGGENPLNDSHFTKTGSGYKYSLDLAGAVDAGSYSTASGSVTAEITASGGKASRVRGSAEYKTSSLSDLMKAQMKCSFDLSPLKAQMSGEVHVQNVCKVEFTLTSTVRTTSETVPTAPPAGDTVIPMEDLVA